jgi:hypothetical protein
LEPPPLNLPIKRVPIPRGRLALPEGNDSALLVVREGGPFLGTHMQTGRVMLRSGRIEFTGQDQQTIEILYRLPQGLSAPPDVDTVGDLSLVELSDPGGPNRRVVVRTGDMLLLAEIWLASSQPVTINLGRLRLVQRPTPTQKTGPFLADVQLDAFDGERAAGPIGVGKPTQLESGSNVFLAYIETSGVAYFAAPKGEPDRSYVLHAWVVRAK